MPQRCARAKVKFARRTNNTKKNKALSATAQPAQHNSYAINNWRLQAVVVAHVQQHNRKQTRNTSTLAPFATPRYAAHCGEVCVRTPSIYIAICYAHARQHSRFSCCCCAIFKHRAAMGHVMQRQQQQPNCIRIYNTCKWQLLPSFSICNLESCNILATQSPILALTCRYRRRYVVCQVCQCC